MTKTRIVKECSISLPSFDMLNEKSFKEFVRWHFFSDVAALPYNSFKKGILKEELKKYEGEPSEVMRRIGEIELSIKFSPTHKRPAYGEILDELQSFLEVIYGRFSKGMRQEGVRKINGKPYIKINSVLEKIEENVKVMREGKESIIQRLEFICKRTPEIPETLTIVYGRDYSTPTESNAILALYSRNFIREGNSRAKEFKNKLLEDSFNVLGDEPENTVELSYPFEHFTASHIIIPERTPQNKELFEKLFKKIPRTIRSNSKIGDYVMLSNWKEYENIFKEKGLINEEFMRYDPRIIDSYAFVSLEGMIQMLKIYRNKFVKKTYNQKIIFIPK